MSGRRTSMPEYSSSTNAGAAASIAASVAFAPDRRLAERPWPASGTSKIPTARFFSASCRARWSGLSPTSTGPSPAASAVSAARLRSGRPSTGSRSLSRPFMRREAPAAGRKVTIIAPRSPLGDQPAGEETQYHEKDDPHHQKTHLGGITDEVGAQLGVFAHPGRGDVDGHGAERLHLHPEIPDQHAPENRAEVVAGPADDDHHPDKEGEAQGRVRAGRELPVEGDHHRPRYAEHRRTENEDLQMPPRHILAHGLSRGLVVADRAHHPPPGRGEGRLRQPQEQEQHGEKDEAVEHIDPQRRGEHRVDTEARRAFDEGRVLLKVDLVG